MAYQNSLDKQLFSKFFDTAGGKIVVSVFSYNNGPSKLQITREVQRKDGTVIFTRLGRLSKDEIQGILPLIKEAVAVM